MYKYISKTFNNLAMDVKTTTDSDGLSGLISLEVSKSETGTEDKNSEVARG
jgi:hypothetical protein